MEWIEALGDDAINKGTPLSQPRLVTPDGVEELTGDAAPTGFSIVRADDMDAALEIARACPFLEMGTLEVAQVMQMPG